MITFEPLWETMRTRKVTTYQLREHHGIDSRTIRRLRNNQNITTDTLNKLCRILECTPADILAYSPDQE